MSANSQSDVSEAERKAESDLASMAHKGEGRERSVHGVQPFLTGYNVMKRYPVSSLLAAFALGCAIGTRPKQNS